MMTKGRRFVGGKLTVTRPGTANDNDCDVCGVQAGQDCRLTCDCDVCQDVVFASWNVAA